ncbi:MAG TPA: uracil-DNA glycosylase family protein [Longimicrobiales bacterium]|nr:uracil-DNA glycosylase family protein [Longimicrobiales bacterium]
MSEERRPADEARFRSIFRAAHADHASCAEDEWLNEPCRMPDGTLAPRPLVWSRRNGPWRRVAVLWVGAAPGNAGGLGSGTLGAHATRIPFGGDIAGGNLDVLLGAAGMTRNETFIVAALNQLPARGGGEPAVGEIAAPVGAYPDSVALLRDTIVAAGPRLIIALGNVAVRVTVAAVTRDYDAPVGEPASATPGPALRLPGPAGLARAGIARGTSMPWPADALPPAAGFGRAWAQAWHGASLPSLLQVLHPSAQNMSPFAGATTVFHRRMLDTRAAVRDAVAGVTGRRPPAQRPALPDSGIYALPEWRDLVGPAHARYDGLWREHGV